MENENKLYRFLKLGIFCFIILSIGWMIVQVMVVQGRARNQEKEEVINRIQNEINLVHFVDEMDSEEELKERYIKSVYSAQGKLKEEGIEFYSILNRLEKRYQENEAEEIAGLTEEVEENTNPAKKIYEKCLDGSESMCQGAKNDFSRLTVMDIHGAVMSFDWGEPGVSYQADYVFYYPTAKKITKDYMGLFIQLAIIGLFFCIVFNALIHWVQRRQKTMEENRKNMTRAIAHELKTPLAVMKNYLEMLQEESEPEKRQSYQEIMGEEIGHMDTLVLDMLELSRLEAGVRKTGQEEVELISLTRGLLQRMQEILKEKKLRVSIQTYPEPEQEEMIVKGDIRGLQMMVNNYLTNAIKNTSYGKTIQIRIKDEGRRIRYEVYNQGVQLSKKEQKKIWVSFYKNDSARTRHFGSSGLGLAIVKMMAKEMKGKAGCHTEEKGMNFWFTCQKYK